MPQKRTRVHTFEAVAREWLARQAWSLAESAAIRGTLVREVFPEIGALPIREVTARHITAILERLEEQDTRELTATVRQWCVSILAFAVRSGLSDRVIAIKFKTTANTPSPVSVEERLARVCRRIDALKPMETRVALNLLLLLLVHPKELCRAEWTNIDLLGGEWKIPATAMPTRKPHVVPLAAATVDLLSAQRQATGSSRWVLTRSRGSERAIESAVQAICNAERSSWEDFRGLAGRLLQSMRFRPELIELQLRYDRTEFDMTDEYTCIAERRTMMSEYATALERLHTK